MIKARNLSLTVVFAALGVVFDAVVAPGFSAGVWFSGIFMLSPIVGIVLGPYKGFVSMLIGVMVGHWLVPRETFFEFVFTLGAPTGAMMSGFAFRGEWKKIFAFYTTMLAFYFISPITWHLPIWGMWDVFVAYGLVLVSGAIISVRGLNGFEQLSPYAISAFVGLEADVLLRIFIFIPCHAYQFLGYTTEALVAIWSVPAPVVTPFKVLLSTFITTLIAPQIMRIPKITDA
jgi:hypothetical protein